MPDVGTPNMLNSVSLPQLCLLKQACRRFSQKRFLESCRRYESLVREIIGRFSVSKLKC
jgi:hypothetical protein